MYTIIDHKYDSRTILDFDIKSIPKSELPIGKSELPKSCESWESRVRPLSTHWYSLLPLSAALRIAQPDARQEFVHFKSSTYSVRIIHYAH